MVGLLRSVVVVFAATCFADGFLRPPRTAVTTRTRWRARASVVDDVSVAGSVGEASLQEKLVALREEREQKRLELMGAEMAVRALESALAMQNISSPLVEGSFDYGFSSRSEGCDDINSMSSDGNAVPASAMTLALSNFRRELSFLLNDTFQRTRRKKDGGGSSGDDDCDAAQQKLSELKLSNAAIWAREHARPPIKAPLIIKLPYLVLCVALDTLFDGKPIERFYFLETVARMPYFSYITCLHAYETLGWWRRSTQAKRVHFAEEFNEYNHLLIMEALGGDQQWRVRFLAQHAAIVYYFILIGLWVASPSLAYNFSELIEAHAVDTYGEFADSNKALLQQLAAPRCAKEYYENPDMHIFDEFQTALEKGSRRPAVNTLYDVFKQIEFDEGQHVATMAACQDPDIVVKSPNTEAAVLAATAAATFAWAYLQAEGLVPDADALQSTVSDLFSTVTDSLVGDGETASLVDAAVDVTMGVVGGIGAMLSSTTEQAVDAAATLGAEVTEAVSEGMPEAVETVEAVAAVAERAAEAAAEQGPVQEATEASMMIVLLAQIKSVLASMMK